MSPCRSRSVILTLSTPQDDAGDGEAEVEVEEGSDDDESEAGEGRGRDPNAMTQEEEDDFTRELAKMMVSSNAETRKVPDRKPVSLDVGIPLFRRQRADAASQLQHQEDEDISGEATEPKGMQFTLLTKKGNKPQVRQNPITIGSHSKNEVLTDASLTGSLDGDSTRLGHRYEYYATARTEQGGARTVEAARPKLRVAGRRTR